MKHVVTIAVITSITIATIIIANRDWQIKIMKETDNQLNGRNNKSETTIFLSGDVMTGRGVDQILPCPSEPTLYEGYIKNAKGYVKLAEEAHGPINAPVDYSYIWGVSIDEFQSIQPDVKLINLETSVTTSDDHWKGKGINYRMHPENIKALTSAGIDCSVLANNHVLDWGYDGLKETITTLDEAGIKHTGAGKNVTEAKQPAIIDTPGKGRVIVFSLGLPSSGIPHVWAAQEDKAGIYFVKTLSSEAVINLRDQVKKVKQPNDIIVASIHWGSNWGYEIPSRQTHFAHLLIDEAYVDIVHGHSSHHFKGIEVYNNKPIIYGAGDFINDYEGISGHEEYRDDLTFMYFITMDPKNGNLLQLKLVPLKIRHFQLNYPSDKEIDWMKKILNREGKPFNTSADVQPDQSFHLKWDEE